MQTYRKPDASLTKQPVQVALNVQQTQFVQTWLNAHREGWLPHNPMAHRYRFLATYWMATGHSTWLHWFFIRRQSDGGSLRRAPQ